MLNSQGMMCRSFNFRDILFGVLNTVSNEILLNYIVLESKLFIYRTKLKKTSLSHTLLIEKIRKTYQIECHIAKKITNYIFIIINGTLFTRECVMNECSGEV